MSDGAASCPVCRTVEYQVVFDLRSVSNPLSVPGLVVRCRCGMWFKIPDERARPSFVYGAEYAVNDGIDQYMTGASARALFRNALGRVGMRMSTAPTLLDIGTGHGALLEEASALGYVPQGIDLCEPLVRAAQARGLRVEHGRAEDLPGEARFDVVTMTDVIEHVTEPRRLLADAYRLLKTGGRLVVYTPNHRGAVVLLARALNRVGVDFAVREIFGGNHVCFFDDRSLPDTLRRERLSLESLTLFPYDPARPGGPISRLSLAAVTAVERLGAPFQRMFRMLAVATK